tara:strand:+ start:35 stop:2215 length:2181 start_codon:yes stop_codon:yes gene_type:complete
MENKFLPLGYAEMLERMKYKDMLERLSSTNDPAYGAEQFVSPREPGPTEKFGNLIGKGLYNLPFAFDNERSAMASGQDAATVASFTPGPGNVLGFLEGEKMAREGQPFLGTLISGLSAGIPVAGKAGNVVKPKLKTYPAPLQLPPPPPPPAPRALQHKVLHTADRPKEIKDVQGWNAGSQSEAPYRSSANLMPLRYGDNDTQMMSQIALAESDFYKKPNKVFPIENILQGMRRYGVTGKGNVNQNVDRQIGDFLSEEFVARGNATPAQVMLELQRNAPKIQETHAYYGLNSTMEDAEPGYSRYITKRPVYDLDSPTTSFNESAETMSQAYGERKFNMFDDGRLYGKPGSEKVSFKNSSHNDLAIGNKLGVGEKGLTDNNYMHQRYTFETIDGQDNVLVGQEFQSDVYALTKDQTKLVNKVKGVGDFNPGLIQYEVDNYSLPEAEEILEAIKQGDNSQVGRYFGESDPKFYNYLYSSNKLDEFNEEYGNLYRNHRNEYEDIKGLRDTFDPDDPQFMMRNEDMAESASTFSQKGKRLITNYMDGIEKFYDLNIEEISKTLPRSADWFTDNVKTLLQTGAKSDSPFVLIPNGARSLAPPSGNLDVIPPKMIPFLEDFHKNDKSVKLNYDTKGKLINIQGNKDGYFRAEKFAEPDKGSINRAKSYNDFLKKAMKQTEQDYGVKLNATEYIDAYDQEFLKIELTPELKEAFKTFRMNHGGVASLMPLKYDL